MFFLNILFNYKISNVKTRLSLTLLRSDFHWTLCRSQVNPLIAETIYSKTIQLSKAGLLL